MVSGCGSIDCPICFLDPITSNTYLSKASEMRVNIYSNPDVDSDRGNNNKPHGTIQNGNPQCIPGQGNPALKLYEAMIVSQCLWVPGLDCTYHGGAINPSSERRADE